MNWICLIASTSKAQNPNIHRRSSLEEKTDRYKVDVTGLEQRLYLPYTYGSVALFAAATLPVSDSCVLHS